MEFVFQISRYDDPALDREAAALMDQRIEAYSREKVPGLWKITDRLNAFTAKGPGRERRVRRYRIYGVVFLLLGIFVLVPGLMEPRQLDLILVGAFAAALGLFYLFLPKKRGPGKPSRQTQAEAAKLLARMRGTDWTGVQICCDENGVHICRGEEQGESIPYAEMTGAWESARAWLVAIEKDRGLMLQKKDLISGNPQEFLQYLKKIKKSS